MQQARWLGYFRRALRFLRPQRRRIALAILCSLGLAVSLVGSLSAVQPILRIFVTSREGPRAAVFTMASEQVFGVSLQPYDSSRHGDFGIDLTNAAMVIKEIHEDSPLAALAREGDVLLPVDGDATSRQAFIDALGTATEPMGVHTASPQDTTARSLEMVPPAARPWKRFLISGLRLVGRQLPVDTSPQATQRALFIVLCGVFVLVIFSNGCRFAGEYLIIISSNRAVMDMRRHMYATIMHLPITWFGRHLTETMSRVVTDCRDVERGYRALFGKLTTEPLKIVVLLVAAVATDWRITLMAMVAGPLGILIVSWLGKKIRRANRKLLTGYAQMMGVINAALTGMKVVRGYNKQTVERRRMWSAERRLLKQLLRIGRLEALTGPLLELTGVGVAMIGILILADYVFSGQLKPERFLGLVVFMIFIFDAVRKIAAVYPRLAKADGAAQRVFEMIDKPTETRRDHTFPPLAPLQQAIDFRNVTFTYPEAEQAAIKNLSLTIRKGQKVALVGPNGSGKTTCIGLLERFMDGQEGQIFFDDQDITQYSIASLRDQISLITQDAVIFALSVTDNIAYGLPRASVEEVVGAARKAHAHEFIERLPEGYDTVLGEYGATLSGGERRRLALARAVLRNAPIFILDEATSQIDMDSEKKIQQATAAFMSGRTSIVIAHRIHAVTDADQIAVLNMGELLDLGTHQELVQRCELYRTLYYAHSDR